MSPWGAKANHFGPSITFVFYIFLLLASNGFMGIFAKAVDPCATVGPMAQNGEGIAPSQFRACLRTFPYRAKDAKTVLDIIWKMLIDVYVYTDLAIKSPDGRLESKIDLRKQFIRIQNTKYTRDFDFHLDLIKTIYNLRDGHTGWDPKCYLTVTVQNGLPMVQVFNSKTNLTEVKIAPLPVFTYLLVKEPELVSLTAQALSVKDITVFAGAQVLKIDGLDSADYIEWRTSKEGSYRNLQSRVNNLFFRLGIYETQYGSLMQPSIFPDNDTLTLTVRRKNSTRSEVLQVPYNVFYRGDSFNNGKEYYNANCRKKAQTVATAESSKRDPTNFVTNLEPKKKNPRHLSLELMKSGTGASVQLLSSKNDYVKVYLLEDMITAVMAIPSFIFNDDLATTMQGLITGYLTVRKSGASRLIIELSDNGGGFSQTGAFLTQLFFPDKFPGFLLQFKANSFVQEASKKASKLNPATSSNYDYRSRNYANSDGTPIESSLNFFYPLVNKTINNYTSPYSSLIYYSNLFTTKNVADFNFDLPTEPIFPRNKIMIVSNGLCFSTCALFSYQMVQRYNITAVSVGGKNISNPFQIGDGAVGFISDFNDFYSTEVVSLKLRKSPYAPPPNPIPGNLRFVVSQAIGPKSSTIPQEFIYAGGNYKIRYTDENVVDVKLIWKEATKFFPKT